jgi:cell surface protein SprA
MIINSDERQWTWMDEGLNTFMEYLAEITFDPNFPVDRGPARLIVPYMSGAQSGLEPIMTNSESIRQFGSNAYGKPAAGLNILRETIMGRELFDHAFKEYSNRWKFKHPTPGDFFRSMEDASGVDLDWFWRGWFYGIDHVDIALDEIKWYRVNSMDPEKEMSLQKVWDSKEPEYISENRNKESIKETLMEKNPALKDVYNDRDKYRVTEEEKTKYKNAVSKLSEIDKEIIKKEYNYYEIKYPLKITPFGTSDERIIWPEENELSFDLTALIQLKNERNLNTNNPNAIYRKTINGKTFSIRGNPNLGEVKGILAGLENLSDPAGGRPVNAEVWINELRLSGLDEDGGWAAVGQMNVQLADLGSVSMSANVHTIGFGQLEQRVNERFRDDFQQFDISTNLQLGKLLPKQFGLEIPFFANLSQTISTPEFDPYDKDVTLKEKLRIFKDDRDSIRNDAVDYVGLKTINFTNVRFNQPANKKIKLWSISNFDFSYSFTETKQNNPLVESNQVSKSQGGLGYNYSSEAKYIEPFKKMIKAPTRWLDFIRNFNFNPMPSLIGVRVDTRRQFGAFRPRNVGGGPFKIPETYDKYFVIDRNYNMRWDLTRSLNVDFKAINNSRVDEPFGRIDNKEKRDSLMKNFLKGGRNTIYNQSTDITYNFPTSNFPFLDWTTLNVAYRSTYNWVGASRLAINLGNTIQNSGQTGATAEFNFTQLYSKSKLLRALEESNQADGATKSALKGLPKKQLKKKKGTAEEIAAKLTKEEEKLARKEQKRLAKEERQQRVILLNGAEKAILNYHFTKKSWRYLQ